MVVEYRCPGHSDQMQEIFGSIMGPYCGIDLPAHNTEGFDIELKECYRNNDVAFTVHEKDNLSDYILFYSHKTLTFYLVTTKSLNIYAKRRYTVKQIDSLSKRIFRIAEKGKLEELKNCINLLREGFDL